MTEPQSEVVDNADASRFEIVVDGTVAGLAQYTRRDGVVTMTPTEVDSAYEGRGLGSALVRHALDSVRAAGAAVVPTCPFVSAYMQRHREYADLVPADRRAQFGPDAETG